MRNKIANKNASEYVNRCEVFQGNNTFSESHENLYVVYSYGHHFPMYVFDYDMCEWYENNDKYSSSTSKQQTQCRPRFGIAKKFNTEDLKKIIARGGMVEYVKWKAVA